MNEPGLKDQTAAAEDGQAVFDSPAHIVTGAKP